MSQKTIWSAGISLVVSKWLTGLEVAAGALGPAASQRWLGAGGHEVAGER